MTDTQEPVELDGMELKKYIEFVVREVKKEKTISQNSHVMF
jgi:Fe-S cluster assembly ATPase SufC